METTITISEQDRSTRLDVLVAEKTGNTRSQIQRLIRQGLLLVNEQRKPPGYRVRIGDVIILHHPAGKAGTLLAEGIPLTILYADEHLVVVD
jgi:23S rRNA pseudouridine1911/1915/1917 synthase